MTEDERVTALAARLEPEPGSYRVWATWWGVAERIIRDPQAHIDALVEAGVLREVRRSLPTSDGKVWEAPGYIVAVPHKHEWRVETVFGGGDRVSLRCSGCPEVRHVSNRVPLEVPEEGHGDG